MKKLNSYTMMELIISISAFSVIMLSIYKFYYDFTIEDSKLQRNEKFLEVAAKIEKSMSDNYLNFIISKNIVNFDLTHDSETNSKKISNVTTIFEPNTFYPLYSTKSTDSYYIDKTSTLFNMSKLEMELFANEPFEFIFTNGHNNYFGIQYPFKDIYLFNWSEVRLLKGFTNIIKSCFLDGKQGYSISSWERLSVNKTDINGDKIIDASDSNCEVVMKTFIDKNDKVYKEISKTNYRGSYLYLRNKIDMLQISNFDFVLNKVKETYNNFTNIVNSLKDFAKREIEFATNDKETMIDHFVFCYLSKDTSNTNYCDVDRDASVSESQTNTNKIKFMIDDEVWVGTNLNSARTTDTIKNSIFTIKRSTGGNKQNGQYPVSDIRGTTANNIVDLDSLPNNITLKGLVGVDYPNTFSSITAVNENKLIFNKAAYDIFGTVNVVDGYYSSKTNAFESFLGIPFYFSNVSLSEINFFNNAGTNIHTKYFGLNTPIILPNKRISSGPYASLLVAVFPWVYDATKDELKDGFGYFTYQIESSR